MFYEYCVEPLITENRSLEHRDHHFSFCVHLEWFLLLLNNINYNSNKLYYNLYIIRITTLTERAFASEETTSYY